MMSPKHSDASPSVRPIPILPSSHAPFALVHFLANFMRIWSVYSMYHYLSSSSSSVLVFIFTALVPASVIFLLLQKPWKGRPLSNSQLLPTLLNGAILAFYFILWGKGLYSQGPLLALLAEYSGAVLGVLSALFYGRRIYFWKKVGGFVAMLASFYFLSKGWATQTYSPFYMNDVDPVVREKRASGIKDMLIPICAGILSALRRVIARRVALKNQVKRRLHAITVTSATCFLFPFAMWDTILGSKDDSVSKFQFSSWAYLSMVFFGIVFIFYADNIAEERLHLVFSTPRHLMVTGACIIIMEMSYKLDFSLLGFLVCSLILGLGIHEATSFDRSKTRPLDPREFSEGTHNQIQMSPLPS